MKQTLKTDIAIIGAGSAGLSLAAGASQMGAKVVLIEQGAMGGDCLNTGCVPSKSLLAAAKAFWQSKKFVDFGIHSLQTTIDFAEVMQHVQSVMDTIAVNDSAERFEKLGCIVLREPAKFLNRQTLQAGDTVIHAKRIVIATGSAPFIPPIPGLTSIDYLTNETIFKLSELPEKLVVIGGGPIGCELAQAFAMLGSQVTLLEAYNILPKDEHDCVDIVREQLLATGMAVKEQVTIEKVAQENNHIQIHYQHNEQVNVLEATHVLVATGRRINVGSLNLKAANIEYTNKGIQVNANLRTTNKKVYAIGDVVGSLQFTHMASYHAGIVLKNILFRLPAKVSQHAVPWVTYTEPEIAHVGLLTLQAQTQKLTTTITQWSFKENDRAQAEQATIGKIKIMTDQKARVLGVTIVGAHAGELILPWVMAVREKMSLRHLTDVIVPYPTLSEISKRVAGEYYRPAIFSTKVRRIVRWLLKLSR